MGRIALLMVVLACACSKTPVGPDPTDLCERQAKLVGGTSFNMPGCIADYTDYRQNSSKKYECYAMCVDKGGDREAFIACSKLCRELDK